HGCWGGKILGGGLTADFLGELKVWTMSGVIRSGAMTPRFSAVARGTGDGTRLKVAEFGDLPEERGSVVNQGGKRISHGVLLLTVCTTLRFRSQKKKTHIPSLPCRAPVRTAPLSRPAPGALP